ncbi:MAG: hypothetical protein Fur0025_14730 [Oscillatoriaceae cyanobacterium]
MFNSFFMLYISFKILNNLDAEALSNLSVFYPVHTMPMYSQKYQKYQVAEGIGWRGINLPSYPDLSEEQIKYICDTLNKINY